MTTPDGRPAPEQALALAREEQGRGPHARLKIFFGFAPGVGKTYRMLQVARDLAAQGVDVVIGMAETHGRQETAALLKGLERLPRRQLPYRGRVLEEFDLDAALARRPAHLVLDELAHTNAPGARHAKRWQDVQELLEAGIQVHTTLNVQHLESLNDVVEQITGVQVRETVPDAAVDRADELELVDLAPEALLQRLAEGKVYLGEQAERARTHFFQRGNLLALRELALRRVAAHVDADVQAWREAHGVAAPWRTAERVLVCVGPAPESARVIRAGQRIAAGLRAPWVVTVAESARGAPFGPEDRERLEGHLRLAESLGAEVIRTSGPTVPEAVLALARRNRVTRIVLGKPHHARWRDRLRGSMLEEIIRGSGDIEVNVVSGAPGADREPGPRAARPDRPRGGWREDARALAVMALVTGAASLARQLLQVPDLEMLFLLGVLVTALTSGRRAALVSAGAAVLAYDFLFVPPYFTLDVSDGRYLLSFAMMFGVSLVVGSLAQRLREQQAASVGRERRTSVLYALSRELGGALDAAGVAAATARGAAEACGGEVTFLGVDPGGGLHPLASAPGGAVLGPGELAVAQWVADHGRPAGRGTDTLPGEPILCTPARTFGDVQAVLAVRPAEARGLDGEQRTLLEALARQAALALDRVRLADAARRAALRAEAEELRSGLLSSVSHDLRTPLAAITGAATALREDPGLDAGTRRELIESIVDEAERLERLVGNLLDMTRLDQGAVAPRREWVPADEVLGSALTRLERRLAGHRVRTDVPGDLPLLSVDPVLLEQLFANLLENAAKYTPAGTEIAVSARREGGTLIFEVADRGPGIPAGDEERIFDRFHRGTHAGVRGVGLGLPIARAIALVHGGRLTAANRPGGGAVFRLALPVEAAQPEVVLPDGEPGGWRAVP